MQLLLFNITRVISISTLVYGYILYVFFIFILAYMRCAILNTAVKQYNNYDTIYYNI